MTDPRAAADAAIRAALHDPDVSWEESTPGTFVVTLPGTHKLKTTCSLVIGDHGVSVNAFVVRAPEENRAACYRWLLDRNRKTYGVHFALDQDGDVYLVGQLPLHGVTAAEVDLVLGQVVELSDGSFDRLLELGFADAIRREWAWRVSRGESLANLQAFRHLVDEH